MTRIDQDPRLRWYGTGVAISVAAVLLVQSFLGAWSGSDMSAASTLMAVGLFTLLVALLSLPGAIWLWLRLSRGFPSLERCQILRLAGLAVLSALLALLMAIGWSALSLESDDRSVAGSWRAFLMNLPAYYTITFILLIALVVPRVIRKHLRNPLV